MGFTRFGGALLAGALLLSACGLFESQSTRREKAYERYIGHSQKAQQKRQKAMDKQEAASMKAAARQEQQADVRTGPEAMSTPGTPERTTAPVQGPEPMPAASP